MKNIFTLISHIYWKLYYWAKIAKYSRYKQGHKFEIDLDGFKYKLTFKDKKIGPAIVQRIEGRREPETTAIYNSIIKPGMKVLELGACYGEFTVLINSLVGSSGELIAVEGTPKTFQILQENFRINKLKNTKIYEFFIKNSNQEIFFGKDDSDVYDAINRIKKKECNENKTELNKQKSSRLTHFLNKIQFKPDIIVMDIEGFEVDVIEDLFLDNHNKFYPTILFEIHKNFYSHDKDLNHMLIILKNNNYYIRRISNNILCYHS